MDVGIVLTPFKFLKVWTSHPTCVDLVKQVWSKHFVGCPMAILSQKLKALKLKLRAQNKHTFDDVHQNVSSTIAVLANIQNLCPNSEAELESEVQAQLNLEKALDVQETFLKEKARIN